MSEKSLLLMLVQRPWLIGLVVVLLVLPSRSSALARPEYELEEFDTLRREGIAWGINRRGDVAGFLDDYNSFLYRRDNGMTRLFGGRDSRALDVNNHGVVVGQSGRRPVLWRSNGTRSVLDPAYGGAAVAISEAGHVAGTMYRSNQLRGFLYSRGALTELATLGGNLSSARDVNNRGQVVGTASLPVLPGARGEDRAVRWTGGGAPANLGTLGGNYGDAQGINEKGEVVGQSNLTPGQYGHAFLYSGGMRDLGTLGGDLVSTALDINEVSEIVGSSSTPGGVVRAFLWRDGEMIDLNRFLRPQSPWSLLAATAINDSGDITGWARRSGVGRPFLLRHQLHADPGGPYTAVRAMPIALDGSGSAVVGRIKRYDWTFEAGPSCPEALRLSTSKARGAKLRIVALCDLTVRLKVTGRGGGTDSAETRLTVERRGDPFAETPPVAHREQPLQGDPPANIPHPLTPRRRPWRIQPDHRVNVGINLSDCAPLSLSLAETLNSILCPYVGPGSREGRGYRVARVNDPDGPFDDFWYVSTTGLSIQRVALYNPWMRPDGPPIPFIGLNWQAINHARNFGPDVDAYWSAVRAHEGMGVPGRRETGHSGAIAEALKQGHDPRRAIEPVFASTKENLTSFVDRRLARIERELDALSDDPLPHIWGPRLLAHPREDAFFGTKFYAVPEDER